MRREQSSAHQSVGKLAVGFCFALLVGCGGSQEIQNPVEDWGDDQKAIKSLVESVPDVSQQTRGAFRDLFTDDAVPSTSEMKKYDLYVGVDEVTVSGNTATIKGEAIPFGQETGSPITWKAEKVDGQWKLSSAPLP